MGTGGKSPQELCSSSSEDVLLVDGVKTSAGVRKSKQARHGKAGRPSATRSSGAAHGAEKRDVEASVGRDEHVQSTSQTKKTRISMSKEEQQTRSSRSEASAGRDEHVQSTSQTKKKRAPTSKEDEELPPGWVKVKSRSKPGACYYAHPASKHTQAERPVAPRLAPSTTPPPSVVGTAPQLTRRQSLVEGQRKAADEQRNAAEEQRKATDERKAEEAKQKAVQRAQEAEAEEAAREELLRRAREKRVREKTQEAESLAQDNKPEAAEIEESSDEEEVTLEDIAKWKEDEEHLEQQGCMESPNVTPPDPAMQRQGEDEDGPPTNGHGVDPRCLVVPESGLMGLPMQAPFLQPCFQVLKFGVLVETHLLAGPKQSWTVGRATEHVDITLNHVSISRQHAVVMRHGAQMLLMDLGSTHGTALNGQRLEKNRPVPLTPGGRACFGASTRVFIYFESPSMVPTLSFPGST